MSSFIHTETHQDAARTRSQALEVESRRTGPRGQFLVSSRFWLARCVEGFGSKKKGCPKPTGSSCVVNRSSMEYQIPRSPAQFQEWIGLFRLRPGPVIRIQRDLDIYLQGCHRSRLGRRGDRIYNTGAQSLTITCAVPPMHCVLAELERERDLIGYIKPTSCGFEAFAKDGRAI